MASPEAPRRSQKRASQWQTLDGDGRGNSMNDYKEEADEEIQSPGCGIFGRYPVRSIVCCAIVGVVIGYGLSLWVPETSSEQASKDAVVQWIGLVGDLFIRALKCVVLPMVFISVMISIVDMMSLGKAGLIAKKTVLFYLATTILAAIFGVISLLIWKRFFKTKDLADPGPSLVMLGCNAYEDGFFLTEQSDGSVACLANPENEVDSMFVINDVTNAFAAGGSDFAQVSIR